MFQNIGTYNAGVIGGGGPASGSAIPTMDAEGIASGGAFLVSELEKRDPLIRKPLTSITYPRDIPIQTGGGWVDYVSAMTVASGITGGSGSGPVHAGGANSLPIVQVNMDKGIFKAHIFAAALRVMFVDMQKAGFVGRPLDQLLQEGMRLAYDKHMDEHTYMGLEDYGTTGLLNNSDITETTVSDNGSGSTHWADKTPRQILDDVNSGILTVWEAAEYDPSALPNHILLPYAQYAHILNTPVTDLATETIFDYIQKNNVSVKNGGSLYIGAARWCKGAGTEGMDRMAVYVNSERFLKLDELVPLNRVMTAPNAAEVCYDTAYMANVSEVQIFYPQTMLYLDGV